MAMLNNQRVCLSSFSKSPGSTEARSQRDISRLLRFLRFLRRGAWDNETTTVVGMVYGIGFDHINIMYTYTYIYVYVCSV